MQEVKTQDKGWNRSVKVMHQLADISHVEYFGYIRPLMSDSIFY